MSCRHFSLRHRAARLIASVFRRRWHTGTRRPRRPSVIDRLAAFAGNVSAAAGRVADSHMLTLASPESLEQRAVMDVAAGVVGSTLGIWMEDSNANATAYISQFGDGAGAILRVSSVQDGTVGDVYEGAVPAGGVRVYAGASFSLSATPASGGGGYTSSPTVTVSTPSFSGSLIGGISATLTATAVIGGGDGGSGYKVGDIVSFSQPGISTQPIVTTVTSVGSNIFASNYIAGLTITSPGAGFTNLLGLFGTGGTGSSAKINFSGAVDALAGSLTGTGYYGTPTVTFTGGGGAGASAFPTIDPGQTWTLTGLVTDDQSSQLSPDLNVGISAFGLIQTVVLGAGSTGGIAVSNANDITLKGNIAAPTKALSLTLAPTATGNITIGSSASVASISIDAGPQDFTASGGVLTAVTGAATVKAGNATIETVLTGNSNLSITAVNDLTLNGTVSTGPANSAFMLLQATKGNLLLNGNATAANGTITVSAPNIGTTVGIAGPGLITGRTLSLREGGASKDFSLNANVSSMAGNIASNLTFTNARDLSIGNGAFTIAGTANSVLVRTTNNANLNVVGNIVMSTGGVLSLEAANSSTITGSILPGSGTLDVNVTAVNGSINAASSLNLGTGNLGLNAALDIKAPNINVANLSVFTANGTAAITSVKTVSVRQATVGSVGTPGVGNLTLTTLQGDVAVDGEINSFSNGTVTLQANNGNINISDSVFVNTTTGSLVVSAVKGVVSNAANGSINTANLTWNARTGIASLLNTPSVSNFSRISANITGVGNDLVVYADRPLSVGSIVTTGAGSGAGATKAGNVTITADVVAPDRADLTFNGTIDAGNRTVNTLANVTLSALNGAITSTGNVAANILTLNANYASSITNQLVNQLNATLTGTGENLTVSSARDLTAGNIKLQDATLDLYIKTGNLTRSGSIDTGATGVAKLNVANGTINGSGKITADSLQFSALATPDLSEANATFTRLSANITRAGNITLTRASNLTIDQASTTLGSITLNVDNASQPSTDLTINGPLVAAGNGNVTLNVPNGAINITANAAGNITANVLNVVARGNLALNTSAATLVANITAGSLTINEANGLAIGGSNVIASNDVTINVLAGNLTRNGFINASNTSGTITLNVAAGSINGTGGLDTANLVLTSQGSTTIGNAANVVFANVSATVTGPTGTVTIDRTGDYTVLNASTVGGTIALNSASGNIAVTGNVTAGGSKDITLSAATGSVTFNTPAVVTGGNLTLTAQNDSSLTTNVAKLSANVTSGNLTVTALNGLVGAISADSLNVTANGSSTLTTSVTNLTANVTGGGLTVTDADDLWIQPVGIVTAGPVSLTSTAGNLAAGAAAATINAGTANVALIAPIGKVTFANAAGQIVGNVLTLTSAGDSTVNTAVNQVVATVSIGSLVVNEVDDLLVGAGSTINTPIGSVTLNIASGNISGSGTINAGAAVTLRATAGGITLNSAVGQVSGTLLNVTANKAVNVNTTLSGSVAANVADLNQGFTINQNGSLTINGANIATNSGDITINATGLISRTGTINAGSANVLLKAGTTITGAGLITGNVLTVNAATTSSLATAVNFLQGGLTSNLASLTVTESDSLDIGPLNLTTSNGTIAINLAGNLAGSGIVDANSAGNVQFNTTAGGVLLAGIGQVRGNILTVNATGASNLGTSVAALAANVGTADLVVTDVDSLNVAAGNVSGGNVTLVVGTLAAGSLGGNGSLTATGNVVVTAASGAVTLTAKAGQVTADNLVVTARADSALNTSVTNLSGTVSAGGLTIEETNGLVISPTDVTTTGPLSINVAVGSLSGAAGAALNAGSSAITLNASAGGIVLNATAGQVKGGLLTLTSKTDANVSSDVATLVANVTSGNLVVSETSGLAVGTSNTSTVGASGDVSILLYGGNLNGPGIVKAGSLGNVAIQILGTGDVSLAGTTNRVVANRLDVSTSSGSINVASAVNTVTAAATLAGNITVSQAQGLTINQILAVGGDVNVALSAGNLKIDANSILGGQLSNVTLNAAAGSINTVAGGIVFGNVLDVRATASSSLDTSVTALKATMGTSANLTIHEADDTKYGPPNGLAIASDVVLTNGTLTLNLVTGNLTGSGRINVGSNGTAILNIASGAATLNTVSGQVAGGVLQLTAANTSSLNTAVTTLNATVITGMGDSLTINEVDDLKIGMGDLVSNAGALTVNLGGNLSGPGNIVANGTGGLGNVVLNSTGGNVALTNRANQVVANTLTINAKTDSGLNTLVTGLAANVTAGGLTISETDALTIAAANVVASGGIAIKAGSVTGTGQVNAGSGAANVSLVVTDSVQLTSINQVVGNVLTLTAVNSSNLSTKVQSLVATLSAPGQTLTIREADGLTGSVTAGTLNLTTAAGSATFTTNVATLAANVTGGSLTIVEQDDLTIDPTGVSATGIDITVGGVTKAGNLTGFGLLTGRTGNVTLSAANGAVTLNAPGQVVGGNVLTLVAKNTSALNTSVATLNANITGPTQNLTIVETDNLTIGTSNGVLANGGLITIQTLAGDLLRNGEISATATGNVTLKINGATSGTGLVTANVLNITVANTSSINTSVNTVISQVTNPNATLSIYETNGLNISGPNVGGNGTSLISVANGNLDIIGAINAPNASLTLIATNGTLNAVNNIYLNQLSIVAANVTPLDTRLNALSANITGPGNGLTVVERDNLVLFANGAVTSNGPISIRTGNATFGCLTLNAAVKAGSANVLLNANGAINGVGTVSGNVLTANVLLSSTVATDVNAVQGTINGASQTLTINENNGLLVGVAGLAGTGASGAVVLNVAAGALAGAGPITTSNGAIRLQAGKGDITMTGAINAGIGGSIAFTTVNGAISLTGANQVSGNQVTISALGNVAINTAVAAIVANVTGDKNGIVVTERDDLTVSGTGIRTANGPVTIATGRATSIYGNLSIAAPILVGNGNVTFDAYGSVTGVGTVTANTLTANVLLTSGIRTNVNFVQGTISGASQALTITEQSGLQVGPANLAGTGAGAAVTVNVASGALNGAGNIVTNNGAIAVVVGNGPLNMTGVLNAGSRGNVAINVSGLVSMTVANQIVADQLTVLATGNTALSTAVNGVAAQITGVGSSLQVADADGLTVAANGVLTNNGDISITSGALAAGRLYMAGPASAGTANVTLVANGSLDGPGLVSGNVLTVNTTSTTTLNTSVNALAANTGGSLTVTEAANLVVATGGIRSVGSVNLLVGVGTLSGQGAITGTNVTLSAVSGGINLSAAAGQVSTNLLTVSSNLTAAINTNVASLAATVTNGSLLISEVNTLLIAPNGISTAAGNGSVALTILAGGLSGTGRIDAGTGNVAISVPAGNVTLNAIGNATLNSSAWQVGGNVFSMTTLGSATVSTSVASLNATVTATGNLTVNEANNLVVNNARTTNGTVTITTTTANNLDVSSITAATGVNGNVTLVAGNVNVYTPGITASGTLNLSGVGNITVYSGGLTANTVINQSNGNGVNWGVTNSNSSGDGSLNAAITNANKFNGKSQISITAPTTVILTAPLPVITKTITLAGNNNLTIDGAAAGASASGLTVSGTGVVISGVTLKNFGGAGIDLMGGATGGKITGVTVLNSAVGLRATGSLAGAVVAGSTFDAQNRANSTGALLSGALGLTLGTDTGAGKNIFRNATVGMTASGDSTGTVVRGNTFEGLSRFGISLAATTNLTIGSLTNDPTQTNTVSAMPSGTGVFASGFCTGSSVNYMTFSGVSTMYDVAQSRNLTIRT